MNKGASTLTLIVSIIVTACITMTITFLFYSDLEASIDKYFKPLYLAGTTANYPATADYPMKFDKEDAKKVLRLQKFIDKYYYQPTDEVDYEAGIFKGLFKSLNDPYSVYMTKDEFTAFNESSAGSYAGIGVQVDHGENGLIRIVAPFEGTPGDLAGLQTGDEIVKVNGEEVFAEKMDEAIKKMKGEAGTDVTLTIRRDGKDFDVDVTRAIIVLDSVKSRMLDNGIGYMKISSFDDKVSQEFKDNYHQLETSGATKLIIDLRGNPGGSLNECVALADFVLGEQLIVYTDDNHGNRENFTSDDQKINLPYVILVDGGSASASEVLTGAVKDTHSGMIIGTTTFGKGLVQSVYPLDDGSGVKLTTAQYFTPNGTYIHGVGIEPDIVVEQSKEYNKEDDSTDAQLQEAIRVLNN